MHYVEDKVTKEKERTPVIESKSAVPESTPETGTEIPADDAKPENAAYAEFGGLLKTIQDRQEANKQRRDETRRAWEQSLQEKSSARMALAERMKPEDTSLEQRNLRRLAIGQSLGEFLGALTGGIIGLGNSKGRGYVAKMPGLYNKTFERIQKLKDYDIQANQQYKNLLGNLSLQDAGDSESIAREQYKEALADERSADTLRDYMHRQDIQTSNRRNINEQQAGIRADLQDKRHKDRLAGQANAASLRGNGRDEMSGDEAIIMMSLLPKTSTTAVVDGKSPHTTIRDRTSYSKSEIALARSITQRLIAKAKQCGVSTSEIIEQRKKKVPAEDILTAMEFKMEH